MMERNSLICIGLGFGDEGKGSIVDYLVRQSESKLVVRFSGGPQCAHNVVTPDGRHHTFAQFGSGSFVPGVKTYLAKNVLVNIPSLLNEAEGLAKQGVHDPLSLMSINEQCVVITEYHKILNRLIEYSRGDGAHGSCAQGVGVARDLELNHHLTLQAFELLDYRAIIHKLQKIKETCLLMAESLPTDKISPENMNLWEVDMQLLYSISPTRLYTNHYNYPRLQELICGYSRLECLMEDSHTHVFEGNQGALIDEKYGTAPHNTWTDTTIRSAKEVLNHVRSMEGYTVYGVMRAYMTRHGHGPFPTEDPEMQSLFPEPHNGTGKFQGAFRVGFLDLEAISFAMDLNEVYRLAVNHLDMLRPSNPICTSYLEPLEHVSREDFVPFLRKRLRAEVAVMGIGPTYEHKRLTSSK